MPPVSDPHRSPRLWEKREKTAFQFLALPVEIRVMIYRLILIISDENASNDRHEPHSILVSNMRPDIYQWNKRPRPKWASFSAVARRTAYQPIRRPRTFSLGPRDHTSPIPTITYTMKLETNSRNHDVRSLADGMGILSVNRQIWNEAAETLYGENIWVFRSVDAVIPFLKDRKDHWQHFRHLKFELDVNNYIDDHENAETLQQWIRIFQHIGNSPSFELKHLTVTILDPCCTLMPQPSMSLYEMNMYHDLIELYNKSTELMHGLSDIRGLDTLKIQLSLHRSPFRSPGYKDVGPLLVSWRRRCPKLSEMAKKIVVTLG